MIEKLFVYGTLGPGRPNEHVMNTIGGNWENGFVKGKLHQQGWGAELGYPGIELGVHGDKVEGYVFSSENLVNHWGMLDEFEGEGYERVLTQATLDNGNVVEAYIYVLQATSLG